MPKVFEWKGYRFFFFSNEGIPREPRHIHVKKGGCIAKFWIEPEVALQSEWGFTSKELNQLRQVVEEHADLIRSKWNEYFSSTS
jgi:hypothetical protein